MENINSDLPGGRVTEEAIEENIVSEHYFTAYEGVLGERFHREGQESDAGKGQVPRELRTVTLCTMVLRNGFVVIGKSGVANAANYVRTIGEGVARRDAINQIWPLMGYELRSRLSSAASSEPRNFE
jgi:hypothetical protein